MTWVSLKIYAIPVRVFTEPTSGFCASTFRETPNSRRRGVTLAPSATVIRSKKQIERLAFGRSGAHTMLHGSYSITLVTLRQRGSGLACPGPRGCLWKYQRDRYYVCRSWCASAPTPLLVKFFRSTHSRASDVRDQHHDA